MNSTSIAWSVIEALAKLSQKLIEENRDLASQVSASTAATPEARVLKAECERLRNENHNLRCRWKEVQVKLEDMVVKRHTNIESGSAEPQGLVSIDLVQALLDSMPPCTHLGCTRPATRAWARGQARFCDECAKNPRFHGDMPPEYPRAAAMRALQAAIAVAKGAG